MNSQNAGLYIHIPFCEIKCGYCDFFVVTRKESQIPVYLKALKNEIEISATDPEIKGLHFETLYLGGGTPSLLSAKQISGLIQFAKSKFQFASDPEITVETNPGTVDYEKLKAYRDSGVNRLSIGAQTFKSSELHFLDRNHTNKETIATFETARKAGFDNFNIDLIFGLPNQKLGDWQSNLKAALELEPEHISTYGLTYEEGTPLTKRLRSGKIKALSDANARVIQLTTMEFLNSKGFNHYEISNYARFGKESQHNQKYWDGSPYLGLGVSAHSFINKKRFWNVRNFRRYNELLLKKSKAIEGEEILEKNEILKERVFLGLRQKQGLHLHAFQNEFGISFFRKYSKPLLKFFSKNFKSEMIEGLTSGVRQLRSQYLKIENGYLRFTREGILLSDAIFAEFF